MMENPAKNFGHSAPEHGFENVLASYVRSRTMSIKDIQKEWAALTGWLART